MSSDKDPASSAAEAELKEVGGGVLAIVFKSVHVPIILSAMLWGLYGRPLSDYSCSFMSNPKLLSLWPANLNYISQLHGDDFSQADRCWFFALTSSASLVYVLWFCWMMGRCVFVLKRSRHVPGTAMSILPNALQGLIALGGVGLAVAAGLQLAIGFEPSRGMHGLSTLMPIGWSASKVVFFIMPFSYVTLGSAGNLFLLLLRYLAYAIKER